MSTYIQVNIYNQTLDVLKMRGLDLKSILKTIGCPDTWVTEVPIPPSKVPRQTSLSTSTQTKSGNDGDSSPSDTPTTVAPPPQDEMKGPLKRPFKSISGGLGYIPSMNLANVLGEQTSSVVATGGIAQLYRGAARLSTGVRGLFDEWDPTANLDIPSSSEIPTDPTLTVGGLKVPKEEVIDEGDDSKSQVTVPFDLNDTELANEQEKNIIEELLRQQKSSGIERVDGKKKTSGDDSEVQNMTYVITCNYPGCGLQYNWRVKYGKLRLLDHALTHSDRKIPCRLCGFECTNVRRMRSHYSKVHPNERVEGYGMKALVCGDYGNKGPDGAEVDHEQQQVSDEELKALWKSCYSDSLDLVGHATGFVDGEKYRRMTKRRKMERDSMNQNNFMF